MTNHKPGCMALQAWDEPSACTCASLPSSTPPQVSDKMRELVERYHDTAYEVGRFGEDPNHPPRRSWSAVTAERSAAESALLREIAALEEKAAHGDRGTLIMFSHYLARRFPLQCAFLSSTGRVVDEFLATQEAPHA